MKACCAIQFESKSLRKGDWRVNDVSLHLGPKALESGIQMS